MSTPIKIKVDDSGAKAKLAALDSALGKMQPVYAVVGNVLLNRIRLCFKLGIDPWGSPWAKIKWRAPRTREDDGKSKGKSLTAAGRAQLAANAQGKSGAPLRDTGLLQRSISAKADGDGVTLGTNKIQARIHQFGGVIKPKKAKMLAFPGPTGEIIFAKKVTIPARPYLPLRRDSLAVNLPPAWSLLVVNALRTYLRQSVDKVEA
ncbi:phage virion morphogenesis protein [Sphingomonas sp.]|uniref:phage virion morphogenesis protein n=1 Tax=Sphingomonas sp. TaxID=28214 RepID=UPI002DD644CB|nr:phage virion morphogenesis protein [Sphingomonas sp.]